MTHNPCARIQRQRDSRRRERHRADADGRSYQGRGMAVEPLEGTLQARKGISGYAQEDKQ